MPEIRHRSPGEPRGAKTNGKNGLAWALRASWAVQGSARYLAWRTAWKHT